MLKQVKNILKNLDGDCHLCTGKLIEINLDEELTNINKRILCQNCKTSADSYSFGRAYFVFSDQF